MAIDLDKLNESPHLLDILVQMEDVLDSFDLYVFKNWFTGEIVEGPRVRRYWFDFTLRYNLDQMPDSRGALRLIKHGLRVKFTKVTVSDAPVEETDKDDAEATHWDVVISIPRRLITDMNAGELDFYDEEIEVEDVQDAQDAGMTDETAYMSDDGGAPDAGFGTDEGGDDAPKF